MGGKALVSGRGRKAKPVARKQAAGNPGKRALNTDQPEYAALKNVDAPEWIEGYAREMWERVSGELCSQGVLTIPDLHNLEAFCDAYGRWREARDKLKIEGLVVEGAMGGPLKNPYVTVVNESLKQLVTFGALLGLDPSSRQRLMGGKKPSSNGFTGLL